MRRSRLLAAAEARTDELRATRDAAEGKTRKSPRTTWQMSLTVEEKERLAERAAELGMTRAGYVKSLLRADWARAERERRRESR